MQDHQPQGCFEELCYKTWFPFKSLRSVFTLCIILGILCFLLAIALFLVYINTFNLQAVYSSNGKCGGTAGPGTCQITVHVSQVVHPPILVMYTIGNAYINHARYINSIDPLQLQGQAVTMSQAKAVCHPFTTNQQMQKNVSYTGTPLVSSNIAYPCGFKPWLTFNDTFALYDSAGTRIPINQSDLDPNSNPLFKSRPGTSGQQWISINNQHFQVWTKNQAMIGKTKLWGRIEQTLNPGQYKFVIQDHYQIGTLKISKGINLVAPSGLGGPIYFYPITFIIMGIICVAFAIYLKYNMGDYDQLMKTYNKE